MTEIAPRSRRGGWRGMLGALVAISLLTEPIRTEPPPPSAGQEQAASQVAAMRRSHGVDGTGIGIGVLSTGVATLVAGETDVELLDRVTILPGQTGEGDDGTKTLAILHDLAPGADLYFATGLGGPVRFAANLEALCQAGADVIVDDLFDYRQTIRHQGGLMAQGIDTAVADGCVYVSAAGHPIKSGVWEEEYAPEWPSIMAEDVSTTGESAGSRSDLSSATCVTAANLDFRTFCGPAASPPQTAALVALILEAVGGRHNTSQQELRAAVTGAPLRIQVPAQPLADTVPPKVSRVRISSQPPEGRETYGVGDAIEMTVIFSERVNVTGTPPVGTAGWGVPPGTPPTPAARARRRWCSPTPWPRATKTPTG